MDFILKPIKYGHIFWRFKLLVYEKYFYFKLSIILFITRAHNTFKIRCLKFYFKFKNVKLNFTLENLFVCFQICSFFYRSFVPIFYFDFILVISILNLLRVHWFIYMLSYKFHFKQPLFLLQTLF